MKILRLFVDHDIDHAINWQLLDQKEIIEEGSSTFHEMQQFADIQLEVYLNASCCSIFRIDLTGISAKRLTDELILGMLEDSLVDDIEELKPVLMQVEDDLAYVAIFDRHFYEQLILSLISLDRPIKLVQSFVYSTAFNDEANSWTLYLSEEQSFVRTSRFEYYLLDDARPLPYLLENMLETTTKKPDEIIVYSDGEHDLSNLKTKFGIDYATTTIPLEFGTPVWNVYNQKSSSFKIKIDKLTQTNLLRLANTLKYFVGAIIILWGINIISIYIDKYKLESTLKTDLAKMGNIDNISPSTLDKLNDKLTKMIHERGLRAEEDFIPIFKRFLKVVSTVGTDDITQIEYNSETGTLTVFLRNFDAKQFDSYKDILYTQRIDANLSDYKNYQKANKSTQSQSLSPDDNPSEGNFKEQPISNDTQWVITLKSAWVFETKRK
jgi:hypothetical protein